MFKYILIQIKEYSDTKFIVGDGCGFYPEIGMIIAVLCSCPAPFMVFRGS